MLAAFLVIATGYHSNASASIHSKPVGLRSAAAAGVIFGLAAGFHIQTMLALPGFIIALSRQRGRVKRWIYFLAAYFIVIALIWWTGGKEFKRLSGAKEFSEWFLTSYGTEEKYWTSFHPLVLPQAFYIGNTRTIFIGLISNFGGDGLFENVKAHGWSGWRDVISAAGCAAVFAGIMLSLIAGFSRSANGKSLMQGSPGSIQWGLFTAWLPMAVFSSIFVAYRTHYRLFAWAFFVWLLLMLYSGIVDSRRRRMGFIALVLIMIGLWAHNLVTGPFRWGERGSNYYLAEVKLISESDYGSSPVVLESDFTGFDRAMYLRLFRPGGFAELADRVKGRHMGRLIREVESTGHFWITGQALEELGWAISDSGELLTGDNGLRVGSEVLPPPVAVSSFRSELGVVYLLGWE
jgi:hypothetical protein